MFDNVDIVFIEGDGNTLPWFNKCEKVIFTTSSQF